MAQRTLRCAVVASLLVAGTLYASSPLPHENPHVCGSERLKQELAELVKKYGAEGTGRSIPLPAREPGSPDYLVRVIFLMPTDRQPVNPVDYQNKVDEATLRIQASLETFGDYLESEMVPGALMQLASVLTSSAIRAATSR